MTYEYSAKTGKLRIANEGARIGKDKLILGGTDKRGDRTQRGQFGEGMKLAWMRLLRMNMPLTLTVRDERWVPTIVKSPSFDFAEVLRINFRSIIDRGSVVYEIEGVTERDWREAKARFLCLSTPDEKSQIRTDSGTILLSPEHRGKLYVQGIFVCNIDASQNAYRYGYDLNYVELDRDRRIPSSWSLGYNVGQVYRSAVASGKIDALAMTSMIENSDSEGAHIASMAEDDLSVAQLIADAWFDAHGEETMPVTNLNEANVMNANGMKAVIVSDSHAKIIRKIAGSNEARLLKRGLQNRVFVQPEEIDASAMAMLNRLTAIVASVEPSFTGSLRVVRFANDKLNGTYNSMNGDIELSVDLLLNPERLIATLIHEVAHVAGGDGSDAHRRKIESVSAKIIVSLLQ
jgi:hypothetical protein